MDAENNDSHKELIPVETMDEQGIRRLKALEKRKRYEGAEHERQAAEAAKRARIEERSTVAITFLDTSIPWDTTPGRIKKLLDDFLLRHRGEYPLLCDRLELEKFGDQYIFHIHRVFGFLGHVEVVLANENKDNPKSIVRVQNYSCSGIDTEEIYWEAKRFFEALSSFLINIYESRTNTSAKVELSKSRIDNDPSKKGGRRELDGESLIYRLAKAQEGEEIKSGDERKPWKEIAREIHWTFGSSKAGVKLLEDARNRLKRLQASDPEDLLSKVAEYRRKEKKET